MPITGTVAMIPKARGMYAKRISHAEYEELMRRRTVPEVAAILKRHPYFKSSLSTLSTADPHRGQIEELLNMDIFEKYEELVHYDFSDDNFAGYYLRECEMREILKALHMLSIGLPGAYLKQVPAYLAGKTKVDLFAMGRARSLPELLETLRRTPYYRPLKARFDKDPTLRDFPQTEAALLRAHYGQLFEGIDRRFSGAERKAVRELFLLEVEIYNLELLFRVKNFFPRSYMAEEIRGLMLPYTYRVPAAKLRAMSEARDAAALSSLLRIAGAGRVASLSATTGPEELNASGGRVLYHHAQRLLRLTTSPFAALAAFLTLAKLEKDNVVNIVEGVRYGLAPEKMRSLLRQ